jgi:ADP-heptose:LPS heptosyltransferase
LSELLEPPSHVWVGQNFDSFMALLQHSDCCFIGSGGIMHLAAALQKSQVVLFAKTSIEKWHPLSDRATCLYHPQNVHLIDEDSIMRGLREMIEEHYALSAKLTENVNSSQ